MAPNHFENFEVCFDFSYFLTEIPELKLSSNQSRRHFHIILTLTLESEILFR